jgi:hypothetical protein
MFLGGIMFSFISKKVTLVIAAIVAVLLVLEPTSGLTVTALSLPSKLVWAILGLLFSVINWGMLIMIIGGFAIGFIIKTRTIEWSEVKSFFNKEEA